jgi:uncharacterized membrane protein YbjE (DUF340 family)
VEELPLAWVIVALGMGVILGGSGLVPKALLPYADRLTVAGLALLLAGMGARLATDAVLLSSLQTLGYQAGVLALLSCLGGVGLVWAVGRLVAGAPGRAGPARPGGDAAGKPGWSTAQGKDQPHAGPAEGAAAPTRRPLTMNVIILGSLALGLLVGRLGALPLDYVALLGPLGDVALAVILLGVGVQIGHNRQAWGQMRRLGLRALLLPAAVAAGSILGAYLGGLLVGLPSNESTAVGAGFGWYSLSGVLLAQIHGASTGALAFLANVIRELIAVATMPFLAARLGPGPAIAVGGATTMDTTLPILAACLEPQDLPLAFLNGAVLSALVPVLVPLLVSL